MHQALWCLLKAVQMDTMDMCLMLYSALTYCWYGLHILYHMVFASAVFYCYSVKEKQQQRFASLTEHASG